jgi:hypothetical protein
MEVIAADGVAQRPFHLRQLTLTDLGLLWTAPSMENSLPVQVLKVDAAHTGRPVQMRTPSLFGSTANPAALAGRNVS